MQLIKTVISLLLLGLCTGQLNQAPIWQENLRSRLNEQGILEDTEVGTSIGRLLATDPEGARVTYSTDSDHFEVDENSGEVKLLLHLDNEATTTVSVTFYAEDDVNNRVPTTYTVTILDVNDNAPLFENVPYNAQVPENAVIGFVLFTGISVKDIDKGENAEITLECYVPENDAAGIFREEAAQACQKFRVRTIQVSDGVYTGEIILDQTINYEVKSRYIMTIKARDGGGGSKERSTTVNVAIELQDVQDSPPRFLNAPLSLDVYENTEKDSSVGYISAQDRDTGIPNLLVLRIVSSSQQNKFYLGNVEVDENRVHTAAILTSNEIKRDDFGEIYQFNVEAVELINNQESAIKAETTVTVTFRDRNDNAPVFNQREYFVEVTEGLLAPNQIPGFSMTVTDNDSGSNAQFNVSVIDDGTEITAGVPLADVWRTIPARGTQTVDVALAVQRSAYLDYEQPSYRRQVIKVVAKETETAEKRSSTATVFITIKNVNDHVPRFSALGYQAAVRENEPVGYEVITVTATDLDSPPFNGITYTISGQYSQKFAVDSRMGRITLVEQLDYEATKRIEIRLTATDEGGSKSSVPIRITVLDHNDQGPVFDSSQYKAFVGESNTVMNPNITIHAVDIDSDSPVTYRIASGNTPDSTFEIDRVSGLLTLRRRVDYQETPNGRGFFELGIEGSDNGVPPQLNTVSVIVTVRDENNNSPRFISGTYTGRVSEVSPPGTSIVTVQATDTDAGNNAKIKYVLFRGGRDNFAVDPTSGVIAVATNADLDIEKFGNQYDITVHAVDMGSPQRTATAQVIVRVDDANNQKPTFGQEVYVFSVDEDKPVNSVVSTLTATDIDSSSLLEYSILPQTVLVKDRNGNNASAAIQAKYRGAFSIGQQNGIIRVSSRLKHSEAAEVLFTVEARDLNAETEQQTGIAVVAISIRSIDDDDGLEFVGPWTPENPSFTVSVPEESPIDTVIMQVVAQDPKTRETITDYREVAGTDPNNYFTVDRLTGRVSLQQRLDYDTMSNKQLTFQLEAFTQPPNVRSALATINVNVQDINDNPPQFLKEEYSFLIPESASYPTQFGIIQASDRDSGSKGEIRYSLSGQGASMFRINPETGSISVAQGVTLDRERVAKYDLLVTATDNAGGTGPKQITSVPLRINLQDENDNVPRFSASPYTMYVLEGSEIATSIGEVFAQDPDAGDFGSVTYSIRSGNEDNLFRLETTTAGSSQGSSPSGPTSPQQRIGVIRVQNSLTGRARDGPYILTVRAQDGGGMSSDVIVEVFIEDAQSQEGKPRFRFPAEDGEVVTMPEEAARGTNVTQIIAIDRNPQDDRELTYGFVPNDALADDMNRFHIDPKTGVITVKGDLDRESQQLYELLLVVSDGFEEVTRRLFINLTDINDHDPSFGSCPGEVLEYTQIASVQEEEPEGEWVTTVKACDADLPPNNRIYYFIVCGNNKTEKWDTEPFRIDRDTGEIFTQVSLDHEMQERYLLCVVASSTPELNITEIKSVQKRGVATVEEGAVETRVKRQDEGESSGIVVIGGDVIRVQVNVVDVDDNGPTFGGSTGGQGSNIVAGVLASARIGTEVVRVQASDPDSGFTRDTRYSLGDIMFYGQSDDRKAPETFVIDADSGAVLTNRVSYLDYVDGYFEMTVTATDRKKRTAEAVLSIYVVHESQGLRFIFLTPPDETKDVYRQLIDKVQEYFPTTDINPDTMRYHAVGTEGEIDTDKTDLCFHMVKDKKVLNTETGLQMFKDKEDNKTLQAVFFSYAVDEIDICQVKMTTRWWSGKWWWWWILIALALLILLSALCLICCMCYCWRRFQKNTLYRGRPRPYIVLDPVGIPNGTTPSEYEWQQEIIKME